MHVVFEGFMTERSHNTLYALLQPAMVNREGDDIHAARHVWCVLLHHEHHIFQKPHGDRDGDGQVGYPAADVRFEGAVNRWRWSMVPFT